MMESIQVSMGAKTINMEPAGEFLGLDKRRAFRSFGPFFDIFRNATCSPCSCAVVLLCRCAAGPCVSLRPSTHRANEAHQGGTGRQRAARQMRHGEDMSEPRRASLANRDLTGMVASAACKESSSNLGQIEQGTVQEG